MTFDAILNQVLYVALHPFLLFFYGMFTHFGKKLLSSVTYETNSEPCIKDYIFKHPLRTTMTVMGGLVGYSQVAHYPDFANMAPDIQISIRFLAFGIGYTADSIADAAGEKALERIKSKMTGGPKP